MNGHYQFTSSSDLETFKFVQDTETKGAFTPRHGTVIPITAEETEALMKAFPTKDFTPTIIDIPDSIGVCDGKKIIAAFPGAKIEDTTKTVLPRKVYETGRKPVRIIYYDMLGNKLKGVPHSGIYMRKTVYETGTAKIDVIRNRK
jgi:hypothetical protein